MTIGIEKIKLERKVETKEGFVLPVLERPVRITQGHNGPWSHCAFRISFGGREYIFDDSYSLDLGVPFGSEVIAARSGIVELAFLSDRFYEGLDFRKGMNVSPGQVVIRHENCSSLYAHLGEINSRVKLNRWIEKGETIGKTGKSGWVGPVPHIHFEVFGVGERYGGIRDSCPVKFENYVGELEHKKVAESISKL